MYFLIYWVLKAKYFRFFFISGQNIDKVPLAIGCLFHSGSDNLMSSWFSLKLFKSEVDNWNIVSKCTSALGTGQATKMGEFSEKFQTALFSENHFAILDNGYSCIYARRYEGQIVWNACTWFLEIGVIQYNCWKTYPEPWNYSFE